MPITTAEASRVARVLLFGPGGAGKTRFLGTANNDERTAPILVLDYEAGTSSLVGHEPSVDVWRIKSWQDFNEAYAFLAKGGHKYKSIGLDSISETHVMSLLARFTANPTRRRASADSLDEGDYGDALVQMRKLIRSFRDLGMHFFCTALAKDDRDPRLGMVKKPALAGQFADEAVGIFETVAYMAKAEIEENDETVEVITLILGGYPKIKTKCRLPENIATPPNELMRPTVTMLLDVLGF